MNNSRPIIGLDENNNQIVCYIEEPSPYIPDPDPLIETMKQMRFDFPYEQIFFHRGVYCDTGMCPEGQYHDYITLHCSGRELQKMAMLREYIEFWLNPGFGLWYESLKSSDKKKETRIISYEFFKDQTKTLIAKGIYDSEAVHNAATLMTTTKGGYEDYKNTAYWISISYQKKKRDGFRCQKCGRKGPMATHHNTYKYLGIEHLDWDSLETLCMACHGDPQVHEFMKYEHFFNHRKQCRMFFEE